MYNEVLVPLDGSEMAECVLPHVEAIAMGCSAKTVTFVRVAEPVRIPVSADEEGFFIATDWERVESQSRAAAEQYLSKLMSRVKYDDVKVQAKVLTGGRAADVISDYAVKNKVDLIIIATHGRSGVSRWVWGSVADKILRSASAPVLMIRGPGSVTGT